MTAPLQGWSVILRVGYDMIYLYVSSFIRSRNMVGAHQNLNGLGDLTMPLSGMICHPLARTCYCQPAYQI